MSEELPTLPEPAGALEVDEGPAGHGYPEGARLQSSADGYTADQMREYARQAVLMERERLAALCDSYSKHLLGLDPGISYEMEAHAAESCAHLIMGRNEYGDEPDSEHFGDSFAAAIRSGKQGE